MFTFLVLKDSTVIVSQILESPISNLSRVISGWVWGRCQVVDLTVSLTGHVVKMIYMYGCVHRKKSWRRPKNRWTDVVIRNDCDRLNH